MSYLHKFEMNKWKLTTAWVEKHYTLTTIVKNYPENPSAHYRHWIVSRKTWKCLSRKLIVFWIKSLHFWGFVLLLIVTLFMKLIRTDEYCLNKTWKVSCYAYSITKNTGKYFWWVANDGKLKFYCKRKYFMIQYHWISILCKDVVSCIFYAFYCKYGTLYWLRVYKLMWMF